MRVAFPCVEKIYQEKYYYTTNPIQHIDCIGFLLGSLSDIKITV